MFKEATNSYGGFYTAMRGGKSKPEQPSLYCGSVAIFG
jgi:hypothetical protein